MKEQNIALALCMCVWGVSGHVLIVLANDCGLVT